MDKTISVIGSYGEVVSTDRIVFVISCSSSKTTADEARWVYFMKRITTI